MNEQDTALAVAEAQLDPDFKGQILGLVVTRPSFSATPEVTDHILAGLPDDGDIRDLVLANLVHHHLGHGRVAQAQDLAEMIGDSFLRDWSYCVIIEKLCEFGSMEQAIDIAARIDDTNRTYRAIKKLCELGSIEQAIDLVVRIDDPWTEIDVFQLIGKTLAKSRSIQDLESFLTAQSKPTRLSAAYRGVLDVLVTDVEPNDRLQTDGDSAAPPPKP